MRIIDAIDRLADDADCWPVDPQGFSFRVLRQFPCTVWFDIDGNVVNIMATAHQHRRPNYWKTRPG